MGAGVLVWERADSDGEAAATWLGRLAAHMRRCQEVWREGREQGAKAQEGQRKVQDGRGRVVEQRLVSGTRVLLREEHREHKLAHRFVGPFSVEGDASGGNYWIVDEQGRRLERSFPRDKLFEVPQKEVEASVRQSELYSEEEWQTSER